jgi:hypothetical protein
MEKSKVGTFVLARRSQILCRTLDTSKKKSKFLPHLPLTFPVIYFSVQKI